MVYKFLTFLTLVLPLAFFSQNVFAADAKGQGVYMNFCSSCHASGIAGAPKVGDKQAWSSRIQQGMEVLNERAIKGYKGEAGYMPAKGGNAALSDDEVAAAVAYMVEQSQ